jgi:cysteine synthase
MTYYESHIEACKRLASEARERAENTHGEEKTYWAMQYRHWTNRAAHYVRSAI